ncbi:MAG: EAL and HDOD domain-containing protein [Ilumatobacter sp.]
MSDVILRRPENSMQHRVFVGRQPLLDTSFRTIGYELLFRGSAHDGSADFRDGDVATAKVLAHSVADIGLDHLVGDRLAFVNVTRSFLTRPELLEFLPPQRMALEVLETIDPDDDVINGIKRLKDAGYLIALDDFQPDGPTAPLRDLADIIKYDWTAFDSPTLSAQAEIDRAAGRRVLVERVETAADHTAVARAGADFFQGYFFARPSITTRTTVPANTMALVRLVAEINRPDTSMSQIVELLAQDVAMSVKILRVVNAAAHGLANRVESIQHAAVLIGREHLRSWATLVLMASIDDQPAALVGLALARAKFCEELAERRRLPAPVRFFTVGMLSLLDAMTHTTMEACVAEIAVTDEIRDALLGVPGVLREVLDLAIELEGDGPDASFLDDTVLEAYRAALAWTSSITSTAQIV